MKNLLDKIKKSDNVALIVFAALGLLLNEVLDLSLENTALQAIADLIISLL